MEGERRRQRADELVSLCGCSVEAALLAVDSLAADATLDDLEIFLLSTMSCCHPRLAGADDPTAVYGATDVRRPYAAATNGWQLAPGGNSSLCPMPATLSPAGGLRLIDGVSLLLPRVAEGLPAPTQSIASEDSTALLCIEFSLISTSGQAGADIPAGMYVQLHPDACCDEAPAAWCVADHPHEGGVRHARAIVPCRRPPTGWLCPPNADTCMDRNSVRLALEPFGDAAIPTITFQWAHTAELYEDLYGRMRR